MNQTHSQLIETGIALHTTAAQAHEAAAKAHWAAAKRLRDSQPGGPTETEEPRPVRITINAALNDDQIALLFDHLAGYGIEADQIEVED